MEKIIGKKKQKNVKIIGEMKKYKIKHKNPGKKLNNDKKNRVKIEKTEKLDFMEKIVNFK